MIMEIRIPGYRLHDYQLVIMPNETFRQRVMHVRKEFAEKFGLEKPFAGGAHLPLLKFSQVEMMEAKVINALKGIAMGIQPFRVEVKDYGSYPTHSVYLNTTTRSPLLELVKQLKQAGRLLKSQSGEPVFLNDFNFTIANKLLPYQYEKGWADLKHRSFNARFMVDGLLLLKRTAQAGKFSVVEHFQCLDLPVLTRQGALF